MRTRRIIAERPANIPNDWVIMNASRPFMGHEMWTGDFVSGVFYAALNQKESNYEAKLNFNQSQDATILEYVSRQDVVDEMIAYYQDYPELWNRIKESDFINPDIRRGII